jgi:anti-anti-sigma factor
MEIQPESKVLTIKGLSELDVATLRTFREAVATAIRSGLPAIEVDLSEVGALDASALGVLAYLYRLASGQPRLGAAPVRLLNPQPGVRQMLELVRMDLLFEVVNTRTERAQTEGVPPEDFLQAA